MAHIKNRDVLISTIAATIGGAISFIGEMMFYSSIFGRENRNMGAMIVGMILAPIAAVLVQMAISRGREFSADATAAQFTNPISLAKALEKLAHGNAAHPIEMGSRAHSHQFIVPPFAPDIITKLFSTHPPIGERIERLRTMV